MTVEIEYRNVEPRKAQLAQLKIAEEIEENHNFPIEGIERVVNGNRFVVRVETSLPSQSVNGMLSDIMGHLNPEAEHVETREIE